MYFEFDGFDPFQIAGTRPEPEPVEDVQAFGAQVSDFLSATERHSGFGWGRQAQQHKDGKYFVYFD